MPNSGKPEFGGEGGERSEPGEGRSDFQFELREPLTPPSPRRSGPPDLRTMFSELGQARVRWGEGEQTPCQIKCNSPPRAAESISPGRRRAAFSFWRTRKDASHVDDPRTPATDGKARSGEQARPSRCDLCR